MYKSVVCASATGGEEIDDGRGIVRGQSPMTGAMLHFRARMLQGVSGLSCRARLLAQDSRLVLDDHAGAHAASFWYGRV